MRLIQARVLLPALALAAPALCLAQTTPSSSAPSSGTPATSAPIAGIPAAELPGAVLPGAAVPVPGLMGANAVAPGPMPADYTNYGVAAGIGATDNVNFSSTQHKSQALAGANAFFDLIRSGSLLELNALGNFSDVNYLEHAYKNEVLGRFDGFANFILWKDHLKWIVRDDYGDQQIDPLESLAPTNLQRVNMFSTGPDLTLQPTLSSFVELEGLYSRITYQDSPFDGQTAMGALRVGHQFSKLSSIALIGQVQNQRFDNLAINRNYQVREYYGEYKVKGARTGIDLQGGVDQADDTGAWKSSPLVRLSISREVSAFSSIALSGGREYNNSVGNFSSLATGASGDIPIGPAIQTTANAVRTYGNASWNFQRLRTAIELYGGWDRDAYDRQSQYNASHADVGVVLTRQLSPILSANVMATAVRERYVNQDFTDNFGKLGGSLIYRPGRWVVISGRYDHGFRRPTGGPSNGLRYDQNRVFLMIGYYPHSTGSAMPGEGGMGGGGLP